MVDGDMAMQEIYDLIVFDTTISDGAKQRLTSGYPFPNSKEKADFLCAVLCFSMERSFIKREAGSKKLKEGKALLPLYGCNDKPYWYVTTNKMIASSEKIVSVLFENETEFDPYAEAPPVSTLEEVFFTGYIDGAQITMQEAMDFLTSGKPPRDIEEQLIVNNRMAGSYASKNLYRTIDVNYVCELAGILTDGMDNGSPDFRSTDETDYVSPNGEQFRFPPPQALPSLLNSLCTFLADGNVHPLIKSAVAQAYMTVIRPFPEGNDRLGRILSSVMQL